MSNEQDLIRVDVLELIQTDSIANLVKATKDGNLALGIVNGNLYVKDFNGLVFPAIRSEPIAAGATLAMTEEKHSGKTILFDTAAGSICTLPPSTGKGAIYRFAIKTKATTNSHIVKVENADDSFVGGVQTVSDDAGAAVKGYFAASGDDTLTLNRTTTGSVSNGEFVEVQDIEEGKYLVRGFTSSSGTEATPFSATVS